MVFPKSVICILIWSALFAESTLIFLMLLSILMRVLVSCLRLSLSSFSLGFFKKSFLINVVEAGHFIWFNIVGFIQFPLGKIWAHKV